MVQTMKDMAKRIGSLESEVSTLKERLSKYERMTELQPGLSILELSQGQNSLVSSISQPTTASIPKASTLYVSVTYVIYYLGTI
jgi:hypothetical protein